ncbi:MAG: pyruvate, phosphate dikinase [Tessaracoccus sp.]|uniref:PEP/pyruvate-binding domain-containing protein n=1 Tax=Tessaracoccus sp. TaxID=1971211 RepID=UPI001EBB7E50|nr:PEP/pyruvate-binding domain-containing protein [Tessaracoccus sp.]MBK7822676.1 pyruvate, phosphate dikinase [Tessaracoccus sp.]
MLLTDRGASRLTSIAANVVAALCGASTAWLTGWAAWGIPLAVVGGTVGWFVGRVAGRAIADRLLRLGFAPRGRPVYRLDALPVGEGGAGGKAQALARLTRAGLPVPRGVVVLPRGFDGEQLTSDAAAALSVEIARFPSGQRFAVRSSALAEDSSAASFAGAYESVLNVAAKDVNDAVAQVRRSRDAARVAGYGAATGTEVGDLAVVVQAMVDADLAGVLFTVDPPTGDLGTMTGSMVEGLGESLVSGDATGEGFTLVRPSGAYDGPAALAPFAARMHREAHTIENVFGGTAQDIEWAISGDQLWVVQARPVTTMNPWRGHSAERNDSLAGASLWSATNLGEANPEPQTPLTVSLSRYQQANGGPSMALRGREMAGSIGGRPYANLSVQITARRGKAANLEPREAYRAISGWWGDLPDDVPIPLIPMTSQDWSEAGLRLLGTLARMGWERLRLPKFLRGCRARCAALDARIDGCDTPAALRAAWDEEVFGFGIRAFWAVIAAGSTSPARLEAELREQLGPEDAAVLMSCLSILAGPLESLGPAVGLQQVRAGTLSREEYLDRFGHRGVNETELAWPRPAEDPTWLDRLLADTADGADLTDRIVRQRETFDAAMDRVRARNARLARRFRRRLEKAATQAALRERARSEGVRAMGVARRFALRAGELLGIGEDVFLLTIEELLAALDGDHAVFALLDLRRETVYRYRELPPMPGIVCGPFDPFAWAADPDRRTDVFVAGREQTPPAPPSDGVIVGHPGALGRVEGVVRRLDRFEDADQLLPGEILVTRLTNIGWTPLFPRAGAIVTNLGAPLSHAAIVARELGIPAVVGCGNATTQLRTGDRVLVDGAAGEVRILRSGR